MTTDQFPGDYLPALHGDKLPQIIPTNFLAAITWGLSSFCALTTLREQLAIYRVITIEAYLFSGSP